MNIREKILIVEDEKSIAHFISTVLNNNGYEALLARSGAEAQSMISSHCPDLIILDLGLPDMDGLDILRHLRSWSSLPVVVVSAQTLPNLIRAANVAGVCPVVRVPRGSDIWIDQALDVGAGAVMVPQIDTAEQARAAVAAAKFSPIGNRGTCRFVRSAGFGAIPGKDYFAKAQDTMVIVQAEGKKAVENLDEILDVPGIDVVFVGPYDLSSSLGLVGQIDHPDVIECIKGIIAKASAKGVKVGCFADSVEGGKKWRDLGVKFIGYACDTYIFMQGAKADVESFAK